MQGCATPCICSVDKWTHCNKWHYTLIVHMAGRIVQWYAETRDRTLPSFSLGKYMYSTVGLLQNTKLQKCYILKLSIFVQSLSENNIPWGNNWCFTAQFTYFRHATKGEKFQTHKHHYQHLSSYIVCCTLGLWSHKMKRNKLNFS